MPKLSEIIAKQRAERLGNVQQQKPTQSSSGAIQETTGEKISPSAELAPKPRGSEVSANLGGNGSISRQEKPAVAPKRLGILDRLKADTVKVSAVGTSYTPGPRQAIAEIKNEIQRPTEITVQSKETESIRASETRNTGTPSQNNNGNETALDRHDAKTNDGTVDVESLRRNLEYLALNIEQKELVGNVVRTIAMQLRSQPELIPYMKEADVDLVVRGLRRSYNVAVRAKTEKAEKKGKSTALDVELAGVMKDIGFKLGS